MFPMPRLVLIFRCLSFFVFLVMAVFEIVCLMTLKCNQCNFSYFKNLFRPVLIYFHKYVCFSRLTVLPPAWPSRVINWLRWSVTVNGNSKCSKEVPVWNFVSFWYDLLSFIELFQTFAFHPQFSSNVECYFQMIGSFIRPWKSSASSCFLRSVGKRFPTQDTIWMNLNG